MGYSNKAQESTRDTQPGTVTSAEAESGFYLQDNRPQSLLPRKAGGALAGNAMPVQRKANTTGLPDNLKAGIESLSGLEMDDVKVHYNSSQPAQLQAHAYAQGTEIHIAPGQEQHLPHEAWHVVQQKQGRVQPTTQLKSFKEDDEDEAVEKEVMERIETMGFSGYKKVSANSFTLPHPFGNGKNITIQVRATDAGGDPVLLAGNGENSFVLYVSKSADNPGLDHTIRAALYQFGMHATETPGDLEAVAKADPSALSTSVKGVRVIADKVPQQFQTQVAASAIWKTIVSWLPGLEEENLGDDFAAAALELAAGMHMTLSAASRFTLELCENWFTYNSDKWSQKGAGALLLAHVKKMIPGIIQRDKEDKAERTLKAKDTAGDFIGEEDDTEKVPTEQELKEAEEKKKKQWTQFGTDYPNLLKILQSADAGLQEEAAATAVVKQGKQMMFLLNKFIGDLGDKYWEDITLKEKVKKDKTLDTAVKAAKSYPMRKLLMQLLAEAKIEYTPEDTDYLKAPEPKRKSIPTTRAIDNAVEAKFISRPEAELMTRYLGFATAVRLITYYRKNNAVAAIRGIINQFVRYRATLDNANKEKPVTAKSAVLDTNIARLFFLEHPEPEQVVARQQAEALLLQKGITDIRITNMVLAELSEFGSGIFERGPKATPGIAWLMLPVNTSRDGASQRGDYASDIARLEQFQVGGAKGAPDRQIIADVLHARREPGAKPQFISADKGILKHLFMDLRTDSGLKKNEAYEKIKSSKGIESMVKEHMGGSGSAAPHFPTGNGLKGEADIYPIDIDEHYKRSTAPSGSSKVYKTLSSAERGSIPVARGKAAALLDNAVGADDELKIKHLFALIKKNGHTAMIAGGAVRDFERGDAPKDIDVATDMPIDDLLGALGADEKFKSIPKHVFRLARMNLIKLGAGSKGEIDITCPGGGIEKDLSEEGLKKEVRKRDFSMNTLFVDDKGDVHDPGGRGASDARDMVLHSMASHFVGDLAEKMPGYQEAGRVLKFAGRGYKVAPEQLDYIRMRILRLLYRASSDPRELNGLVEILDKARERTPIELIDIMKQLGFSDRTIRVLYPDAARGYYSDQTPAYEHNISPSRLPNIAADKITDKTPQVKIDTEHGRVYQYRMFVTSAKTGEELMVDVDKSDHGTPGHWAYHYHVYRWIKNKWDKHATGMSASGEAGKPQVVGDKYMGPEPWTWEPDSSEIELADTRLVEAIDKKLDGALKIGLKGSMLQVGDEIELHMSKVRDLARKKQLSTLLMMVRNTVVRGKLPDKEDMARFAMTSSGGERLRFNKQFWEVEAFLEDCAAGITASTLAEKIRLFDLLPYAKEYPKEELVKAAAWAKAKSAQPIPFTHYFEAYLALKKDKVADSGIDSAYDGLAATTTLNRATAIKEKETEVDGRAAAIKTAAGAGTLHFESDSVEKYHYLKHKEDMRPSGASSYSLGDYLQSAQQAVKEGKPVASTEQTGTQSFTFVHENVKVVVKINESNQAHIATAFGLSRQEMEVEHENLRLEEFGFRDEGGMERFSKQDETPVERINRNMKLMETMLMQVRGNLRQPEAGLRSLNLIHGRMKEVRDFIGRTESSLDAQFLSKTLLRIDELDKLILETGNQLNYEKQASSAADEIHKLELGLRLQQEEHLQVSAQIMAEYGRSRFGSNAAAVLKRQYDLLGMQGDLVHQQKQRISGSGASEKALLQKADEELAQIIQLRQVIPLAILQVGAKSLSSSETVSLIGRRDKLESSMKADKAKIGQLSGQQKIMVGGAKTPPAEKFKGIKNGGNTCYLASTLQVMAHTPAYAAVFSERRVQRHPRMAAMGRYIIQQIQGGQGVTVDEIVSFRTELMRAGWLSNRENEETLQQDATELLNFILEKTGADLGLSQKDTWYKHNSPQVQSSKTEPAGTLNIPGLLREGEVGMQQLITNYLNTPVANNEEGETHTLSLVGTLPDVLTVQLIRFGYDAVLQRSFKLGQQVTASQTVDIPLSTPQGLQQVRYDLTSFIVHIGSSISFGHYVSYYQKEGQWYLANDASVSPVTTGQANEAAKDAYACVYKKRGRV